jgi:DNA-binding NarL/FixJ family response regulator
MAIVNMHMPVRNGVETIRWIKRNQPRTLAMAYSPDTSPHLVQSAVQAGARGFLHMGATQEEVHRAAESLQRSGFYYNDHVSKALHRAWKAEEENTSPHALLQKLAPRMLEFLLLYARMPFPTYAVIAERMAIKESVVEDYRKAVRDRTGCRTREEMIDLLVRAGKY